MEFILPLKFENLLDQPTDDRYWVQELVPINTWEERQIAKQLDRIINQLYATDERCLEIAVQFDTLYSMIYFYDKLNAEHSKQVVDLVCGLFKYLVEYAQANELQNERLLECFKRYLVLFLGVFTRNRSLVGLKFMELINNSLPIIKKLYLPDKPEQRMLEILIQIVLMEVEKGAEDYICDIMKWVKDTECNEVWEGWRAKSVNLLFGDNDKCVKPLVSIVKSQPGLLNDFLVSLSEGILANDQSNETQGIKNVGAFIERLTGKMPKEMLIEVSIIVNLLNCESYSLRNSVVISISEILNYIITKDKEQSVEKDTYTKNRDILLDILATRVMDKSSFCRAKVLESFHTLQKDGLLPREYFPKVLNIASSRLLDCTAHARRKATALLESLVYENALMEGSMKIESKESVQERLEVHQSRLNSFDQALEGNFDEVTLGMDKDTIIQQKLRESILLQYLNQYQDMIRIFQNSIKILIELLKSKNNSDVTGSIDVLVACSIRGICETNEAVSAMLSLACNSDSTVRKKILDALFNVYLNKKFNSEEESLNKICLMIEGLNVGQLTSLESVFAELFSHNMIPVEIRNKIWQKYKYEESYPAACLLRFLSVSTEKVFIEKRYDAFINRALNVSHNWSVFRETLRTVHNLEHQGEKTNQFICKAIYQMFEIKGTGWFPVAEQLIRTAAELSENPLVVLKALAIKALKILTDGNSLEFDLAKAIFIGGEVAMKVVVFGDKVANEYKKKQNDDQKNNDELEEINGGKAAQLQLELKDLKTAQENIVYEGLISHFTPIVLKLVNKIDDVKTEILQKTLVITLSKFMCINPKICEDNLESLIRLASKHENSSIRSNAIVGLGDLVMRHPNLLEKYSPNLFDLLSDPVLIVRKKALLIISHLVLNDMLKMKGLMANILRCYLDKDLRGVVSVFIEELNQKNDKDIFNMITDSLSNLLKMKLTHIEFRAIADMIFAYITKERQGEGLSDKISAKFKDSSKEECLHLGYCLTKLIINEKALRKLLDNVSWWQNKLLDDNNLQAYFGEIATKCRKSWKSENKSIIDEFEAAVRGEEEVVKKRKGRS